MPLFELAACVATTAVFTAYKCLSYCISSCDDDHSDHQHVRSHSASLTSYGTFKTKPTYRPHPSYIDTLRSYVRSEPTFKAPMPGLDSGLTLPTQSHIPYIVQFPANLTPALQPTSPGDSQVHIRPKKHEAIRKAPLASLTNLLHSESGEVENVKGFSAEDLRKQARYMKREMQKARKLADRARKEGNRSASKRHDQDTLKHRSAMIHLNQAAAEIIFREKNKGRSEGTVDLHGLYVFEALKYAKQEIRSATLRADRTVRFIVGKGLHSEAGIAKIGPALEQLCVKRGYMHFQNPKNAGVLIVQLDDAGKDVDTKNSDRRIHL